MRIIITGWALDSYLALLHEGTLNARITRTTLRVDLLRLRDLAADPAFKDPRFWGPAQDRKGVVIPDGFKMKWHNIGNGLIQLRVCIALVEDDAFICHGYSKTSPEQDLREAAKLKDRIALIKVGKYSHKGELS